MINKVPFYSQKWDLSNWQELGFKSFDDAQYWERSSCGVLCLKMAIDSFLLNEGKDASPSVAEYIKTGLAINAYEDSVGWKHDGLVALADKIGLKAYNNSSVKLTELQNILKENKLSLVSIKTAFEKKKSLKEKLFFWKKLGGHLALVIGFEEEKGKLKGFYVHHTSIRLEYNWENRFISVDDFQKGFTGRIIVVSY